MKSQCKNIFRNLITVFVLIFTFLCIPLHCNAEEYSKIPYMKVRLLYGENGNTYDHGCVDYRIQTVNLTFKTDGSPAVIDLTSSGRDDKNMKQYGRNYVGGQYYIGVYRESKNLIQNKLKDCLMDVDMDEYLSLDCTKTEIKILPKDAETWNAFEASVGLTEDNYESKLINIYVIDKKYSLKPKNVEELDNPTILTTTRKSEKKYSSDTQRDIPALFYTSKSVSYYHTVKKEEDKSYDILPEPVVNLYWTSVFDINNTQKLNYLEKPATVSIDMIKDAFCCPGYEVDNIYARSGDEFTPVIIDDTYNSNVDIYPHWKRKEGKSTLQVFSSQSIIDIEKAKANIDETKLNNCILLINNILENEISDNDVFLQVSDSVSDIYKCIYDYDLKHKVLKYKNVISSYLNDEKNEGRDVYELDDVFDALDDLVDVLEEIGDLPAADITAHDRYYPEGGENLYELEFDSADGIAFGEELPLLNMSYNRWYKFRGWKVYEWSDEARAFVDSSKYPDLVNPNIMDDEDLEGFLQSDSDKDYYLVAKWEEAKKLHFDLDGKIIGESDDYNGKIIGGNYDVMYALPDEIIDIDDPIREGYDFQGWYVQRYSTDTEGVFLEPLEDDDYSVEDISNVIYGTTDDYYLVASWKRIYEKDNTTDLDNNTEQNYESGQGHNSDNESSKDEAHKQEASKNKASSDNKTHKVTLHQSYLPFNYSFFFDVKNGAKWKDYVYFNSNYYYKSTYFEVIGWYDKVTKEKINENDIINLDSDIELYPISQPIGNVSGVFTFPQFNNAQVSVVYGTTVGQNNFPDPNREGDVFLGWSGSTPPYRSYNDIYYYDDSILTPDYSQTLYAVYSSDIEEYKPKTNQTLPMERIYRNSKYKSPTIVNNGKLVLNMSISEYDTYIENNADKLFQSILEACENTDKEEVLICPQGTIQPNSALLGKSEYIDTGLSLEDYINALIFMHYKYFDVLDMFYTNSIEAKTEQELEKYRYGNNSYFVEVKDFNNFYGSSYLDIDFLEHSTFYCIKPKMFVKYYNYCHEVDVKLDNLIKDFGFNKNTTITDAIDTLNIYLIDNMHYDDWHDIYDLYWFLQKTSSDREVTKKKNVDYHGVCQSYTKLVIAILGKCGYESNYYAGHNIDGKYDHCFNSFVINDTLYFCDFTNSDEYYRCHFLYLKESDMVSSLASHLDPIYDDCFGSVLKKTDKSEDDKKDSIKTLPNVSIKKIKQDKNKLVITCKKAKITGYYVIMYSTDKNFKTYKTVKSASNKFTLKNLRVKQKYYFKVRFNREYSSRILGKTITQTHYGKWSKVVTKKFKSYQKKKNNKKKTKTKSTKKK